MLRLTGGQHKGRTLKAPKGDRTRPTTEGNREALFNILENGLQHPMTHVLDLFAGSGALTCEAISRGAESAVLLDSSREAQKLISENIRALRPDFPFKVLTEAKIERWPKLLQESGSSFLPFDTVFCDPPYEMGLAQKVVDKLLSDFSLWAEAALFCFEISKRDGLKVPPSLELIKERSRGDSKFLIYRLVNQNGQTSLEDA